jgi:hypothetical protein
MNTEMVFYFEEAFNQLSMSIMLWGIGICVLIGLLAYVICDRIDASGDTIKSVLDRYNISREEFDYIMEIASKKLKSGELHIITSDDVKEAARRISNREND